MCNGNWLWGQDLNLRPSGSFKEGSVRHIYFVAETKGSMSSMDLRQIEKSKIDCARKFFSELGRQINQDNVKYDVVTDYGKLMEIVSRS